MKPPKKGKTDFEKVAIGDFILGSISAIQYDETHKFKGFQGKEDTVQPAIRFAFKLQGYDFLHRSHWMKFNYGEKANLYKKYLVKLVENAQPDMDFDLDCLKGMEVKTIWKEENEFQDIETIFPAGKKCPIDAQPVSEEEIPQETTDYEPF